jgi:hypothetical protein
LRDGEAAAPEMNLLHRWILPGAQGATLAADAGRIVQDGS